MEVNVNNDSKTVEIWLTNTEKADTLLRSSLRPLYADYKAKKYTVAVFESGSGDLRDDLSKLLMHSLHHPSTS